MGLRSALRKLCLGFSPPPSNETPIDVEKKEATTTIDEVSSILSSSTTTKSTAVKEYPKPLLTIHCACGNEISFNCHPFKILGQSWHHGEYRQYVKGEHYTKVVAFRGKNISWNKKMPNEVNVTCENKRRLEVVVKRSRKVASVGCKGCRGWKMGVYQRETLMRTLKEKEMRVDLRGRRDLHMKGKVL